MLAALFAQAACASAAWACTGIYVGNQASTDGSAIYVRSNDHQCVWGNRISMVDRVESQSGRTAGVNVDGSITTALPDTTYKYVCTPWMDSTCAENKLEQDAAVAANEYGVSMSMSVTALPSLAAEDADPFLDEGIAEQAANSLVICQSKTAREALDKLLALTDEYGNGEGSIAVIMDQTEAWYVELYTGHQYAAVKLPQDKVAVFGNEFNLERLSDYEEVRVSKDFYSLPERAGFAQHFPDGELDVLGTYGAAVVEWCHMRTWIGHKELAPSAYGDYSGQQRYPLAFSPDHKVSLEDALQLIRNRYEGTEYCPDGTNRLDLRPIGIDTAMSVHALQVFPGKDADLSTVVWVSSGPAVLGVFVPVSVAAAQVGESYGRNQPASDQGVVDTQAYPYYTFKLLAELGLKDMATLGKPVQAYFQAAEEGMVAGMRTVLDNAQAARAAGQDPSGYLAAYCNTLQEKAFSDAKSILNMVEWNYLNNSSTFQMMIDVDTGQATKDVRTYVPIEIDLDNTAYATVPTFEEANAGAPGSPNVLLIAGVAAAAVVVLAAVAALLLRKRA
ncbi:MAG: C69 family dipeptidase [Coriobacteriia bacterium]|nr:C69 family dipeptidase [Coriobacteriia bacterium]